MSIKILRSIDSEINPSACAFNSTDIPGLFQSSSHSEQIFSVAIYKNDRGPTFQTLAPEEVLDENGQPDILTLSKTFRQRGYEFVPLDTEGQNRDEQSQSAGIQNLECKFF